MTAGVVVLVDGAAPWAATSGVAVGLAATTEVVLDEVELDEELGVGVGATGVFVGVGVGVAVGATGVFVGVGVGVAVGATGVFVGVGVGVGATGVFVGVGVGVAVGATGVFVGVGVGVGVGATGVFVGVGVGVGVGLGSSEIGVFVGVGVAVAVGLTGVFVGVALGAGSPSAACAGVAGPPPKPPTTKVKATTIAATKVSVAIFCRTPTSFPCWSALEGERGRMLAGFSQDGNPRRASVRTLSNERVVIVGAGPCGIACARELLSLGHDNFVVLEREPVAGGLAGSVVDPAGFTWDRGGHVVFSHFGEFDRLLDEVMGDDVHRHERSSYVHLGGTWVPYPVQNNLHRMPTDMAVESLEGLVEAQLGAPSADANGEHDLDFGTWMRSMFGAGIVRHFMEPYNEKVWAHPASTMSAGWIAERVAVVDWRSAVRSAVRREDDPGWGPNNLFAFPREGGTGSIYRRAAAPLEHHIRFEIGVASVDVDAHSLLTEDGERWEYGHLVWTGALDHLVGSIAAAPAPVVRAAAELVHNSVTIVGIGYETPLIDDRSWLYFPDADVPFYRATNFAKYAAANVPGGRTDRYCSWMTEVASSDVRPLDGDHLVERVDDALRRTGLVPADAPIASVHVEHLPYAYPVPSLGRDGALRVIQPWLDERHVLSRGRFGAWRYELGNMDHAVKMGVDAARRIVDGTPEQAWRS